MTCEDIDTISIVILTRDGMDTLPQVVGELSEQDFDGELELVAVDTHSTDGTTELLEGRTSRLLSVSPAEFNHGRTRNLAIEHCRGQLIALLVQDAIPASRSWLSDLVEPLFNDDEVAGAFSRQQPFHDASRITRWSLAKWVASRPEHRAVSLDDPARWDELPPMERFLSAAFDNVSSCIRRSVWEQHPFPETPIAEDLAWGKEVLLAGHRLEYSPNSVVLHSHERPVHYELDRTYLVHRQLYELFGVRTIPTLPSLLRSIALTLHEHLWVLRHVDGPRPDAAQVARTLGLAVAWPLGQYLGGVAGVRGEDVMTPRGV